MSTRDQTSRSPIPHIAAEEVDKGVEEHLIAAQILQRLERIEHTLSSMENRFGGRLDEVGSRLEAIDCRLTSSKGTTRVVADKPNLRNQIMSMLQKGWVTEAEIIEFTVKENQPWQTTGVRSFVKKLKTQLGIVVDIEESGDVRRYRIAK